MKNVATVVFLFFIGFGVFCQNETILLKKAKHTDKKYIAWIYPSMATHVYGIAFNLWPLNDIDKPLSIPKTYGAEINLNPLGLFTPFMLAVHSLDPEIHIPPSNSTDSLKLDLFREINGVHIGFLNLDPTIINGLDINLTGSFESITNGVTISGILNKHYIINGLTVALIGNHDTRCNGVQIGLINSCKELNGIQLGLWNKNQKRSLPILNWYFKKKETFCINDLDM